MPTTIRSILIAAIPTVAALLGYLWYRRKKKDTSIDFSEVKMSKPVINSDALSESPQVGDKMGTAGACMVDKNEPTATTMQESNLHETNESALQEPAVISSQQAENEIKIFDEKLCKKSDSISTEQELDNCETNINKQISLDEFESAAGEVSIMQSLSTSALTSPKPLPKSPIQATPENRVHEYTDDSRKEESVVYPVESKQLENSGMGESVVNSFESKQSEKTTDSAPLSYKFCSDVCSSDVNDESSNHLEAQCVACTSSGDDERSHLNINSADTDSSKVEEDLNGNAVAQSECCEQHTEKGENNLSQESNEPGTNPHTETSEVIKEGIKSIKIECSPSPDSDDKSNVLTDDTSVQNWLCSEKKISNVGDVGNGSIEEDERLRGMYESSSCAVDAVGSPSSLQEDAKQTGNLSSCDAHSEVSVDSGKGTSMPDSSPAAQSPNLPELDYVVHCFRFPTSLCGRLIGKHGKNIHTFKFESKAEIWVGDEPYSRNVDVQLVTVEGSASQVKRALELIKGHFPDHLLKDISFEHVVVHTPECPVLAPEIMQLNLPPDVSVDVLVSSVVDVNHVFLQQPTHPTFPSLERLNHCMNTCYNQEKLVPELPRPIEVGVICAAPMFNGWYRAQVVTSFPETDECDIKFVDYGGYMRISGSEMKQIRSDFTTLPFQAIECYLANVVPRKGETGFSSDAVAVLENMVHGKLVQAQVVALEEDGVPYVQLYWPNGQKSILINRELVMTGIARWLEVNE